MNSLNKACVIIDIRECDRGAAEPTAYRDEYSAPVSIDEFDVNVVVTHLSPLMNSTVANRISLTLLVLRKGNQQCDSV